MFISYKDRKVTAKISKKSPSFDENLLIV